jgi:hypothetical protein
MAEKKAGIGTTLKGKIASTGLAKGTIVSAIITCFNRLLFFVIAPVIFINFFISAASGSPSPEAPAFVAAMQQLRLYVIAVGVPLSLVAGLWAYHLRHTKARLYFGVIGSLLLVVYGYMLFLSGPFAEALGALGWRFPPLIAFGIVAYRAARTALRFVRDYEFFNEQAKKKVAKQENIAPFKPTLGKGEFTLKIGKLTPAASSAEKYIKSTITRPAFWLLFIVWFLSIFGFGNVSPENKFLDVLAGMAALFLLVGIPLTVLAFFKGFYPKGSMSRGLCDLVNSILFILLIYWIFVASGLPKFITDNGLIIPIYPIILAITIWALLDVLRVGAEYRDERRNWLKSVGYEVPPKKRRYFQIQPESKWYDFNPSIGKFSRGIEDAKKEVFRFVTIPEILILITIGGLRSAQATGLIFSILQVWTISVLGAGLLIAFIAFWRGYFPPGTYSRLILGLLMVPALIMYLLGLSLGGNLSPALKEIGIVLYVDGIQVLLVILVLFVAFMQLAEFGDYRRSWKIAVGKKVKPYKPIKKMSRVQEFRIRFASKHDGAVWARKGVVRYVFYTSIFIIILITMIDSAVFVTIGLQLGYLSQALNSVFISLILIAIPLAACRALYGFYPGGSTSKLLSGYLMGVAGAAYTYSAFRGGSIMMVSQGEYVAAGFAINFRFIVVLFLIGWILWGVLVTMEYLGYRKQWVANDYRPVETAEAEERAALEKLINKEERRNTKLSEAEKKRAARRAKRRGTTVQAEEEREVAAKEAGVKIQESDQAVAAEEARLDAKAEEEEEDEPEELDSDVEAELKEEIGHSALEETKRQSEAQAQSASEGKAKTSAEQAPPPQKPPEGDGQ